MKARPTTQFAFTLLELVTVLSVMGILLGIGVGAFRRSIPRREIARNQLLDALRRARLFAVAEQSPATVHLVEPLEQGDWPRITTVGEILVGNWHLEGDDSTGFPGPWVADNGQVLERGLLGKAVHLSGELPSRIDLFTYSSFDSVHGFAAEMFVQLDDLRERLLLSKGRSFQWSVSDEGFLKLRVTVKMPSKEDPARLEEAFQELRTESAVAPAGRWTKVKAVFDGMSLSMSCDDAAVAELYLPAAGSLVIDPQADLVIGGLKHAFGGAVDEVRYGVFVAETSEALVGMRLAGTLSMVRFAAGGGLDPLFHSGPANLGLETEEGAPLWVSVGLLGDVN